MADCFICRVGNKSSSDEPSLTTSYIVQATAPENTNLLWIDTSNENVLKFYDAATSTWKPIAAMWAE